MPAQDTYAVQQQSPLFAKPSGDATSQPQDQLTSQPQGDQSQPVQQSQSQAQPVGVKEPAATAGVDIFDMLVKFIAVLGLMAGSLYLLKRFGSGAQPGKGSSTGAGIQVVTSVALAPNRTVHVLKTPDGKSLLVGATPNQVNLIADLGELSDDAVAPQASSFFDVLAGKLARAA